MNKYQFAIRTEDGEAFITNRTYNSIKEIDKESSGYDRNSFYEGYGKLLGKEIKEIQIRFTIDDETNPWFIKEVLYKEDVITEDGVRRIYANYLTHNPERLIEILNKLILRGKRNKNDNDMVEQTSFLEPVKDKKPKSRKYISELKEEVLKALDDNKEIPKERLPLIYVLTGIYLGTLRDNYLHYRNTYFEARNNVKPEYLKMFKPEVPKKDLTFQEEINFEKKGRRI